MISIPPHTSHKLQPLDVSFFGPLKRAFNKECDKFMRANVYRKITPYDIASIFNTAYMNIATIEKGVSGFASTGIFPVNEDRFKEEDFLSCQVVEPILIDDQEDEGRDLNNGISEKSNPNTDSQQAQEPIDELGIYSEDGLPGLPGCSGTSTNGRSKNGEAFSQFLNKFSPVPKVAEEKVEVNSKRKGHSCILTATPMKTILQEKESKRKEKGFKKEFAAKKAARKLLTEGNKTRPIKINKIKKEKKKSCVPTKKIKKAAFSRRIKFEESSSDDALDFNEKDICDDNEDDDAFDIKSKDVELCLVCGECYGKTDELWYRCTQCGKWAHSECSGLDSAVNYICDFCED
jgi:hypothetical protein